MIQDNIGKLQEEAQKRKDRLKTLAQKVTGSDKEKLEIGQNESTGLSKPQFRSYQPQDANLQEGMLPKSQPGDVTLWIQDTLESVKEGPIVPDDLNLSSLAPRKPDWDLKRDVCKKLERLERRTQRAIAELIREKLQNGKENLEIVVEVGSEANALAADDDD